MNISFMKISTYLLFAVMCYLSYRDFNFFNKKEKQYEHNLIKYIHKCEVRIGILLFFIMINLIVFAGEMSQ